MRVSQMLREADDLRGRARGLHLERGKHFVELPALGLLDTNQTAPRNAVAEIRHRAAYQRRHEILTAARVRVAHAFAWHERVPTPRADPSLREVSKLLDGVGSGSLRVGHPAPVER